MWPSFWVCIEDGVTTPVTPDFVQPYTVGILDAARQARLVLDQVALIPSLEGTPLLGIDGKFFEIDPSDQIRPADAATTAPFTGTLWAQNIDGVAQPLIPDFDVTQEYLDYEVEDFLMAELLPALTQWRPYNGHPVLLHAGQLFWRDDDGILAREAAPETLTADHPQLLWRTPQGELIPMIDADTAAAIHATVGTDAEFTEAQVARVLARLQEDNPGACFGYVHGGILFQLAGQGDSLELKAEEAAIAAPYTWPLGHDVRPAAQSLGARGCVDCHATDSSFYFAEVTGDGPLLTQRASVLPMYDLQQVDEGFQKLFGRSFEMRQMFKVVGWAAAGVLTAILIVFAMMGLGRLARWIGGRD